MISVIPVRDIKSHEVSVLCDCNPNVEWFDSSTGVFYNDILVVHNSYDRREYKERQP